jgi:hypothetical protein
MKGNKCGVPGILGAAQPQPNRERELTQRRRDAEKKRGLILRYTG